MPTLRCTRPLLCCITLVVLSLHAVYAAQGDVNKLAPVFPSWDRVIEQLRQATAQQRVSAAASGQGKQLLPDSALAALPESSVATAATASTAAARGFQGNISDDVTAAEWPDDADLLEDNDYGTGHSGAITTQQYQNLPSGMAQNSLTKLQAFLTGAATGASGPDNSKEQSMQLQPQQPLAAAAHSTGMQHQTGPSKLQAAPAGVAARSFAGASRSNTQPQLQPAGVAASSFAGASRTNTQPQLQPALAANKWTGVSAQDSKTRTGQPAQQTAKPQAVNVAAAAVSAQAHLRAAAATGPPFSSTAQTPGTVPQTQGIGSHGHVQQLQSPLQKAETIKSAATAAPVILGIGSKANASTSSVSTANSQSMKNSTAAAAAGGGGSTDGSQELVSVHTASLSSSNRQDIGGRRRVNPRINWGQVSVLSQAPTSPINKQDTHSGNSAKGAASSEHQTTPAATAGGDTAAAVNIPAPAPAQANPLVRLLQPLQPNNLFWWQSEPGTQQTPQQPQQQQQQKKNSQTPLPVPTAEEARSVAESDKQLVAQKILPREPLHVSPPPSLTSVVTVDVTHKLLQIPSSFMGISHEWNHVEDINTAPGYKAAIRLLSSYGTGPFIIRVGGGSTDNTKDLLPQNVYKALKQVHRETGSKFIIGLNFEDTDLGLTRGQLQRARNGLTDNALVTFELGNEPNFYVSKKNMTALEYSRCCFTTEWTDFAKNLSCPCGSEQCCVDGQFAGPVWGHINVYPSTIKWFLENAARYVSLVTVHWYKATKETPNTPTSLLEEAPVRREMDNLRQLVQVANSFGKPLRVAEMNTISNSGRLGVSNVFAAALWTLDGAFEVAAAGAVGINLHQGAGQNLYTAILRREEGGKLKPVVLRPAFYGMLLFQQAVADGSILLDQQPVSSNPPDVKLWSLLDTTTGDLRFVAINKHPKLAATQVIKLAAVTSRKYQSIARLSRLVAQGEDPLNATSGITLGGHYYAPGCEEQGHDQTLMLEADAGPSNQLSWSIYLPPGSATLVRVQAQAGVI